MPSSDCFGATLVQHKPNRPRFTVRFEGEKSVSIESD